MERVVRFNSIRKDKARVLPAKNLLMDIFRRNERETDRSKNIVY